MGQRMGTETRGYSFFVPGFGSVACFYCAKARQSLRQHLYQVAPKRVESMTMQTDSLLEQGKKKVVHVPPQPFTALALINSNSVMFLRHVYVSKGTWVTTAYLRLFQLVIFPTNERFPYET